MTSTRKIINIIHNQNNLGTIISYIMSSVMVGHIAFHSSIAIKRIQVFLGGWSQRVIEYPWVLKQIKGMVKGALVLDVGCSESLLSHELLYSGLKVSGIDIYDHYYKPSNLSFIKRNIMDTQLADNSFDAIYIVSTIEHIDINNDGKLTIDDRGDFVTMNELHRICKPTGLVILTTPYIGGANFVIDYNERNYNRNRLDSIISNYEIVKEDYFYPLQKENKTAWIKVNRSEIDKMKFDIPGLACLILKPIK
jgi:2-polyprenyl-3-methyl-5-hydroxy-6-metoxy-1,4-benzoquinol methylase